MRLEIIRKLNLDILDYEIKRIGIENISYIVMASDTRKELASRNVIVSYIGREQDGLITSLNSYHYYLDNVPIAIFEGLKYGEIELVKTVEEG